ncbi:MtnX-like HAD-IB family phosphatase [Tepidibacter aestuarii]|uniref:MtnX-like HAD-IB family phosphatase n=1 Tax=Tepidibacter aestuarii TaxID=2925782 RepID=UPI0020BE2BCF|nr:MtnX-like HAD-IB family phosphatase [Tepidibacter aestuarii]CAH2215152.1 2-hydroxy-3-keto-5-methylthiopentenyl-1-phosphatephosphatase [Tepidibacter aestuarii]
MEYIVICDFDGTITIEDTVNSMADKFAGDRWRDLDEMWMSGKYNASEISQKILDMMNTNEIELKEFVRGIDIDPKFKEFIDYIREKCIEFYIISDGFDFNIENILEKNDIEGLMSFSNILQFEGSKLLGVYPNSNEDCKKCGNCKSNLINDINLDNKKVIYIGDGHSDKCASKKADYIFAKKSLADYLRDSEIEFVEFEDFSDVLSGVKSIIS